MYFRFLPDESSGAMSYLLADLDSGAAVLIDPRSSDMPVLAAMLLEYRLHLQWLLRTHQHEGAQPEEEQALAALGASMVAPGSASCDGELLGFGNEHLRIIATPGHTDGCLSFMWRDRLFCGDLLSVGACPHQPRPASPEALWDSVTRKVFTLPNETLLFCNHARHARMVSSVLEQRCCHPWFAGASRDEFLSRIAHDTAELPPR